jgi:hypothetical protein
MDGVDEVESVSAGRVEVNLERRSLTQVHVEDEYIAGS